MIAAIVGCGGSSGADTGASEAPADEGPRAVAKQIGDVLSQARNKADCKPLAEINSRSIYPISCPPSDELRRSMQSFEITGAATYGTGGVVDYRSGGLPDGGAIIFFRNSGGKWAVSRFGVVNRASTGMPDTASRSGFDRTVERYLHAVRFRRCALFLRHALTNPATRRTACQREFKATAQIGSVLKRNPDARPRYVGGNSRYGFYTLELAKPEARWMTISVAKTPPGTQRPFLVLDAMRSAPATD